MKYDFFFTINEENNIEITFQKNNTLFITRGTNFLIRKFTN